MGYTAGTLDLSILGVSDSAVASINTVVKSLDSLYRSIQIFTKTDINKTFSKLAESVNIFSQSAKKLDVSGFEKLEVIGQTGKGINSLANGINKLNSSSTVFATQQIANLFEKLAVSTQKLDPSVITSLSSVGKSLSSISNLSRLEKIDWGKVGNGFNNLSVAITPFLNKVKETEASLVALDGILKKSSGKKIQGLLGGGTSERKSSGFSFLSVAKWSGAIYGARRLGRAVYNIAQAGADYTETLNLWQVAMGKSLLPQSEKFIERLNEAYGISEKTLMNAQATFKNMLGGLGQISDEMAYNLSEGITQMALDYASLYNVQFEQAFTKFQAALAGQVRPIRSVSGYDITENTLFQLYQELGGQKTMRQLSRTEKQLLSILAVFQQMNNTGAVGDLKNTINSFANQSRVAADSWDRILTFTGAILTDLIDSSGLFVQLNAVLIFIGDTLKAVAEGMGALEGVADPFANANEGAEELIENTNKVYGLLDFDKLRALDGSQEKNALGLDNSILAGFEQYTSILEEAKNSATELANTWKVASGLFDEDGVFNKEKWDELVDSITNVGIAIGIVFGANTVSKILEFATSIEYAKDRAKLFDTIMSTLSVTILVGAVYSILQAIEAFKEGDYWVGIFKTAIGIGLVSAFVLLKKAVMIDGIPYLDLFGKTINGTVLTSIAGISLLIGGISSLVHAWDNMSGWHQALTIIGAVTAALIGMVVAVKSFSVSVPVALGLGAALAGGIMLLSSQFKTVDMYANGGLPDKGTMFYAGEAGAEIVYNTPSGQSGVANVQQIAQATYAGTTQALNDWWRGARGDMPQFAPASDSGLYERVTAQAGLRGDHWSH